MTRTQESASWYKLTWTALRQMCRYYNMLYHYWQRIDTVEIDLICIIYIV